MWPDLTRVQDVHRKAIRSSVFLLTRCPQSVIAGAQIVLYLKPGAPPRDSPSAAKPAPGGNLRGRTPDSNLFKDLTQ